MADKGSSSGSRSVDSASSIEAQLNLYFLHHSFGSSSTLVTQPLLGTINYTSWSRAMRMVVSGKNKFGFIDGKITKPTEGTLLETWVCNHDIVASWILNSVSKEIAASIVYNGSAKDV